MNTLIKISVNPKIPAFAKKIARIGIENAISQILSCYASLDFTFDTVSLNCALH